MIDPRPDLVRRLQITRHEIRRVRRCIAIGYPDQDGLRAQLVTLDARARKLERDLDEVSP